MSLPFHTLGQKLFAGFLFLLGLMIVLGLTQIVIKNRALGTLDDVPVSMREGSADPAQTVIYFYDYLCPYCQQINPGVRGAVAEMGDVSLIYRPLPAIGPSSERPILIALAAARQNAFPEMHARIMADPRAVNDDATVRAWATEMGLDADQLLTDAASEAVIAQMDENLTVAVKIGLQATPTLLIDHVLYTPTDSIPDQAEMVRILTEIRQK